MLTPSRSVWPSVDVFRRAVSGPRFLSLM